MPRPAPITATRLARASNVAWAAWLPAASAQAMPLDLAALVSSPFGAYGIFAIAVSVVIVLLLWYAVDDRGNEHRNAGERRAELQDRQRASDRRAA